MEDLDRLLNLAITGTYKIEDTDLKLFSQCMKSKENRGIFMKQLNMFRTSYQSVL